MTVQYLELSEKGHNGNDLTFHLGIICMITISILVLDANIYITPKKNVKKYDEEQAILNEK